MFERKSREEWFQKCLICRSCEKACVSVHF